MRLRRTASAWFAVIIGACAGASVEPPIHQSGARPVAQQRSRALEVRGELMHIKIAADMRARLEEDARAGIDQILIDVRPVPARWAVMLGLARAVHDSSSEIHVHLTDASDETEGDRQQRMLAVADARYLALAAQARSASIQMRRSLVSVPSDQDRSADDPEAVRDRAVLIQLTAEGLARRGLGASVADDVARCVLAPTELAWVVLGEDGRPAQIVAEAPAADERCFPLVTRTEAGRLECRLTPDQTLVLGFATGKDPPDWTEAPSDTRRWLPSIRFRGETYSDRAEVTRRWIPSIDRALKYIGDLLDLPDPAKRAVSKDTYRSTGRRGLDEIAHAQEQIDALEQDLRDFPELLRTPPPGQTDVGAKPSSFAAKWRSMIQSRKDKLAKLKEKAEGFAGE